MRDAISIKRADTLHPAVRQQVVDYITEIEKDFPEGTFVRIVQALRTPQEQAVLYAQGRTKPGKIVTNAKPGSSYHEYGLAIDGAIIVNGKVDWNNPLWMKVVEYFKARSWGWGGSFKSIKDRPHLEATYGYSVKQLLDKYNKKDFIPGTEYVNI